MADYTLKGSVINESGEPSDELVNYLGDIVDKLTRDEFNPDDVHGGEYCTIASVMVEALEHLQVHPSCIERRPYMKGAWWRAKLSRLRVRGAKDFLERCHEAVQRGEAGPDDADYC